MLEGSNDPAAGRSGALSLRLHEFAVAIGFVVIPVATVILAKVATGAFVNRYALPAVIGLAVLAGFGTAFAFRRSAAMRLIVAASLTGWFVLSQARE